MKSVLVSRPANVDVVESHSGADTIAVQRLSASAKSAHRFASRCRDHTVLHQDVQAGSKGKVIVEHDESEGERQDIVAGSNFEELAYGRLEAPTVRYLPLGLFWYPFALSSNPAFDETRKSPALVRTRGRSTRPRGVPRTHMQRAARSVRRPRQVSRGRADVGLAAGEAEGWPNTHGTMAAGRGENVSVRGSSSVDCRGCLPGPALGPYPAASSGACLEPKPG